MNCQSCGQREATIHLVEMIDGQRVSQWLCDICASTPREEDPEDEEFGFGRKEDPADGEEEGYSLASFLGQVFEPQDGPSASTPAVCPSCGYTLDKFRRTNRLGCPRCYDAFRQPLLSILGHLHRHVSHLGKSPVRENSGPSLSAALKRTRIALEKAIAAEDFEKAARLRDEIQKLESGGAGQGAPGP